MIIDEWRKSLAEWEKIREQARIHVEMAEINIPAIMKKIEECEHDG